MEVDHDPVARGHAADAFAPVHDLLVLTFEEVRLHAGDAPLLKARKRLFNADILDLHPVYPDPYSHALLLRVRDDSLQVETLSRLKPDVGSVVGTPREAVPSAVDRVVRPAHLGGEINELQRELRRERVVRLDPPVPRARARLYKREIDRRIRRRVQIDDDVVLADKVQSVVSDDSDTPRARGRSGSDYRHVRRRRVARRYLR